MLTDQSLTTQLTTALTHSHHLSLSLRAAQSAHATAEVHASEANDALEILAHRAARHRKRRGAAQLEVRHRMVLAAHNRLQTREMRACKVVRRTQQKLRVAKERVAMLEGLGGEGGEMKLEGLEGLEEVGDSGGGEGLGGMGP
ncbi:hypothetical protein EJ03DRAFT_374336 [Teratosphaeria nubilosa]|uniref:Uncharacterized protein n=1 Tax=Teratosphaeria nubilosa TaxID=161662 RepID=A0A6G1LAJ9_9PEZI|nr:hypothetical protein EJ03DRAFT_374336 [Teratosphaeria nubilosa]